MDNMTALVSAFARAYHYRSSDVWVFADRFAERLLTEDEYAGISRSMAGGISFFAPGFQGTAEEALRHIVDRQLAPSVLARSAFCERAIGRAVGGGCGQVAVFACGYDTFSLRAPRPELRVFELDRPEMIDDRRARIARAGLRPACRTASVGCDLADPGWKDALLAAGFDAGAPAFGSLLGISYYLEKADLRRLIGGIASLWRGGGAICLDYPLADGGAEARRNRELAAAAGERMRARYTRGALEALLEEAGFRVAEHLDAAGATEALFSAFNRANPARRMAAPEGVGYCLARKSGE